MTDVSTADQGGRFRWADPVLLALAVMVTFWPSLAGDFVWDDHRNLLENEAFGRPGFISWGFSHFHAGHYQPLTWMSFAVDRALWGLSPLGYHLTNVLLHALNAVLVLALFRRLLVAAGGGGVLSHAQRWGALLGAAVFALHPLRVESVTWITERRDVLSTTFLLAATLAWLAAVKGCSARAQRLALSLALFALSLLSKASGMGLAAVLLVLDVFPLRRHVAAPGRAALGPGRLLLEKLPYIVMGGAAAAVALSAQTTSGAFVAFGDHGLSERLAQSAYGLAYYPRAMFAQLSWSPLYERPLRIDPGQWRYAASALAVVGVTIGAWVLRRRLPGILAVWLVYLVFVLPVAGAAQSGVQLVADRYSYLSCLGFALLVGGLSTRLWRRGTLVRSVAALAAVALVLVWSLLTSGLTRVWQDEQRLWEHALRWGPSAMAHNNLGTLALRREAEAAVAWDHFVRSLEVMPSYGRPLVGMSWLLSALDPPLDGEALARGRLAVDATVAVRARDPDARFVAGSIALALARSPGADLAAGLAAADGHFAACLERRPDHVQAAFKRGYVLYQLRRLDEAARHLGQAVDQDPDHGQAWLTLGIVSIEQADVERAAAAFARAVALLPESSLAWTGRGSTRLQQGDVAGARTDLQRALQLDASNARARQLLASLPDGG